MSDEQLPLPFEKSKRRKAKVQPEIQPLPPPPLSWRALIRELQNSSVWPWLWWGLEHKKKIGGAVSIVMAAILVFSSDTVGKKINLYIYEITLLGRWTIAREAPKPEPKEAPLTGWEIITGTNPPPKQKK